MWAVQRVFGDDWRTIAVFQRRRSAEVVAGLWHDFGGHGGYRAVQINDEPVDLHLGSPSMPDEMREAIMEIMEVAEELGRYAE